MQFIVILSLLASCSSHLHNSTGTVHSAKATREIAKIIKQKFSYPEDALAFIRTHPFTKTIGIHSSTVARELDIHPTVWGRYVNAESVLVTQRLSADGVIETFIFAKGFTPREQIAEALNNLPAEQLKQGVPIAQIAANISFRQESWTDRAFHISISKFLDKKKYASQKIMVDGVIETFIFAKGFTPREQIAEALNNLPKEQLKQGVPITQLADSISFRQESWTDLSFHISIGELLDRKKYVSHRINIGDVREFFIFAKGFTPQEQIAEVLNNLPKEQLKQGAPITQVADNVSFRQESWTDLSVHISIGSFLDKKKYVIQRIRVGDVIETFIFAKGFTPQEQIAEVLNNLPKEQLKQGVPIAQIAANVSFRQESWTDLSVHLSIGELLDREKYVSQRINGATYILAIR